MDTFIKASRLSWYISTACRNCCSGFKSKTQYISPQFRIVYDDGFTTHSIRITNKLIYNWENLLNNHRELPQEEFQLSMKKKE